MNAWPRRRRARQSASRAALALAVALWCALLLASSLVLSVSGALASPPTVTIAGSAHDGLSPDSNFDRIPQVEATLTGSSASGVLETEGKESSTGGPYDGFEGRVSCMTVKGNVIVVGAVGSAWHSSESSPSGAAKTYFPGTYSQVVRFTFGQYQVEPPPNPPRTLSYEMLGAHDEGIPARKAACARKKFGKGGVETGARQGYGPIHVSPSITSPLDGAVNSSPTLLLAGTAEPRSMVAVYEAGHSGGGSVVAADSAGHWSASIGGLTAGKHVFLAFSNVSTIRSNTVEVNEFFTSSLPAPSSG